MVMKNITRMLVCLPILAPYAFAATAHGVEDSVKTYPLKEVIITATRGSGETLEIPMAVGVVNEIDFALSRRMSLDDVLGLMPGVFAQNRSGGQDVRLTIRGFGARGSGDRSNAATIRGIKVLADGIPDTEPDGRTSLDLLNLSSIDRIEVVRSNASTLFGSASGGVINFETRTSFESPFVGTDNRFGSFGMRKNGLSVGSPIGSGRLFISASSMAFDGWRQNAASSSTQFNSILTSDLDERTNLRVLASAAANRFSIPGALTQAQFDADPSQANPTYLARRERRDNRVGKLAFNLSRTFLEEHTVNVVGFVNPKVLARSERGTYRDFNRYHVGGGIVYHWNAPQDQSVRRITAGVDEAYQDGSILFYKLVNGERGDSLRTNKREGAETFGIFVQGEVWLSDRLSLTVGGRYDKQHYIAEDYAAGANRFAPRNDAVFENFTPKVAVLYKLSDHHALYANYSGGLEAPAGNETDPPPSIPNTLINPVLAPMVSATYEVGAKGFESFGSTSVLQSVSYSLALFRIGITNEIVPYNGGAYFFSAGKSRRYGAELGANLDFAWGISWTTAITFMDAGYESYANDLGDFSSNTVPGIPSTIANTRLRISSDGGMRAELGAEYVSNYYADDANTLAIPSSLILNANVGFGIQIWYFRFEAFVGVNNLTNSKYASSAFINPVGGAFLEPGLPRNLFGGLDINLDL